MTLVQVPLLVPMARLWTHQVDVVLRCVCVCEVFLCLNLLTNVNSLVVVVLFFSAKRAKSYTSLMNIQDKQN